MKISSLSLVFSLFLAATSLTLSCKSRSFEPQPASQTGLSSAKGQGNFEGAVELSQTHAIKIDARNKALFDCLHDIVRNDSWSLRDEVLSGKEQFRGGNTRSKIVIRSNDGIYSLENSKKGRFLTQAKKASERDEDSYQQISFPRALALSSVANANEWLLSNPTPSCGSVVVKKSDLSEFSPLPKSLNINDNVILNTSAPMENQVDCLVSLLREETDSSVFLELPNTEGFLLSGGTNGGYYLFQPPSRPRFFTRVALESLSTQFVGVRKSFDLKKAQVSSESDGPTEHVYFLLHRNQTKAASEKHIQVMEKRNAVDSSVLTAPAQELRFPINNVSPRHYLVAKIEQSIMGVLRSRGAADITSTTKKRVDLSAFPQDCKAILSLAAAN